VQVKESLSEFALERLLQEGIGSGLLLEGDMQGGGTHEERDSEGSGNSSPWYCQEAFKA